MNDLQFAIRQLLKNPGFTAVAVLTLALGIGANTAIFSVVNAVLLQPLPYSESERLVRVYEHNVEQGWLQFGVAAGNYFDWRAQNQCFAEMALISSTDLNFTDEAGPERLRASRVSSTFFPVLKIAPILGRSFVAEEDQAGRDQVVILSHGLWQRRFAGDTNIVGRKMMLNLQAHTVIAVMPPAFEYPDAEIEVWVPLGLSPEQGAERGAHNYSVLARLRRGVTVEQAAKQMGLIAARINQEHSTVRGWSVDVVRLKEGMVGKSKTALLLLLGTTGFVLLIACANVANLLLARAAARQKEFAIRSALGAGRARIIRQLLTESLLLAFFGGGLGLALAFWGIDILVAASPPQLPRVQDIHLDGQVLSFALLVSLMTGAVFGLAPALQTAKADVNQMLKDSGRATVGGVHSNRLRGLLVVSEIALSLVLLVSVGLLMRSLAQLHEVNPGFKLDHMLTMDLSLPVEKYGGLTERVVFIRQLLEQVEGLSGVKSVGFANNLPLSGKGLVVGMRVEGRPPPVPGQPVAAGYRQISPNYFRTMETRFLDGRDFTEVDRATAPAVAIVNERFVRQYLPDVSPIGRRIRIGDGGPNPAEIIGVVEDIKHTGLDAETKAEMYIPYTQRCWGFVTLVIRTASEPTAMVATVRREVLALDKDQPVYNIRTMEQRMADSIAQRRSSLLLFGIFAAIALILATVGIYGVMSYSVGQRAHEIGIRMALGAQKRNIFSLVLSHGMRLTFIGVAMGLLGALALTRVMSSLLYNVNPTDPMTFAVVPLLLAAVALLACWLPARRATKVDPMEALRHE